MRFKGIFRSRLFKLFCRAFFIVIKSFDMAVRKLGRWDARKLKPFPWLLKMLVSGYWLLVTGHRSLITIFLIS